MSAVKLQLKEISFMKVLHLAMITYGTSLVSAFSFLNNI